MKFTSSGITPSDAGLAGNKTQSRPGIDIDIPTAASHSKCAPCGADGVILSRKYFQMKLANLAGAHA
jgi:hypothetical protein